MGDKYRIPFINACIAAFSKRMEMPCFLGYRYLRTFKGIDFLIDYYNTLHLQSIDDAVDDLILICKKNGGTLE